jgi:hypothetical protein
MSSGAGEELAQVRRDMARVEARVARLGEHLDRLDELICGLPSGSIQDGRCVDPPGAVTVLDDQAVRSMLDPDILKGPGS